MNIHMHMYFVKFVWDKQRKQFIMMRLCASFGETHMYTRKSCFFYLRMYVLYSLRGIMPRPATVPNLSNILVVLFSRAFMPVYVWLTRSKLRSLNLILCCGCFSIIYNIFQLADSFYCDNLLSWQVYCSLTRIFVFCMRSSGILYFEQN